jgi:hypothetical protein
MSKLSCGSRAPRALVGACMSVCFTMSVADEWDLVDDRIARLRSAYRDCTVALFPEHCGAWPRDVEVRPIERLYRAESGGLIVERHLEAFLASGCAWWVKVDPDTVAWRPLHHLPEDTCFFGSLQSGADEPSLQGGCIGGTRTAAAALLESGALRSPLLLDPAASWAAGSPNLEPALVDFGLVHAWACRVAGIELRDHPEIRSERRDPPADPWRFGFTHPHKWLDVEAPAAVMGERHAVGEKMAGLIERELPMSASVAVAGKGDDTLVGKLNRRARHFPADDSGGWAGFNPTDSAEAVTMLERERLAGVDHFALPETDGWWLEHYDGLATHLASNARLVAHADGAGWLWEL